MGACCFTANARTIASGPHVMLLKPKAILRKRDKQFFYNVVFTSRPLHIIVTSATRRSNGYITWCGEHCALKDKIILNSKIISVNGKLVEGLTVPIIAMYLAKASLPIKLTLVSPEGLEADEVPDAQPEVVSVTHQQ